MTSVSFNCKSKLGDLRVLLSVEQEKNFDRVYRPENGCISFGEINDLYRLRNYLTEQIKELTYKFQ